MWKSLHHVEQIKVFLIMCILSILFFSWTAETVHRMLGPVKSTKRIFFDQMKFKTGDLLLWSYKLNIKTDIGKLFCGSQYSHTSIVFMDAAGIPYAWETTQKTGNRLVRLEAELIDPRYQCMVRPINRGVDSRLFETFVRTAYGGKYSTAYWQGLVYKWTPYLTPPVVNKEHMRASRFCSELVAYTYERLGVMDFTAAGQFHALMMPGDFSVAGSVCTPLPVTNGYTFGQEIAIKYRFLPSIA